MGGGDGDIPNVRVQDFVQLRWFIKSYTYTYINHMHIYMVTFWYAMSCCLNPEFICVQSDKAIVTKWMADGMWMCALPLVL